MSPPPNQKRKTSNVHKIAVLPLNDGVFKYVILLTKFPSTICCISYYWNEEYSRFVSFNEGLTKTSRLKWFLFKGILNSITIYWFALLLQLILAGGFKFHYGRPLIQTLMESMAIIAIGGCAFGRWMYKHNSLSFTNGFNNLVLYLNRQNYGKKSTDTSKFKQNFLKLTLLAMTANLPVIPLVVFAAVFYFPCLASILGYFLLPQCMASSNFQNYHFIIIINLCASALYILACMATVGGGLVDLTVGLMTNAYYLTESLFVYKRKVSKQLCDLDESVEVRKTITEYRQIQLIAGLFNKTNQNFLIVGYAIMLISFQILSLYICINLADQIPGVFFLLFFTCALNLLPITTFIFGYLADLFATSEEIQQFMKLVLFESSMSFSSNRGRRRWCQRFFKSCRSVRVEFGPFYSVDKDTPLKFEVFAIDQLITFLLMT